MNAETSANNTPDKVRELQRALYRGAKRNRNRRYHALYDKVYRWDVLQRAWEKVKKNGGAAGVDGQTIKEIEEYGVRLFLFEIQKILQEGTYRPLPARRRYIPKSDGRKRPLGIPAVRDRVVQMATKIVIEPIFEADFLDCSYGFRPKRSAHDAVQAIRDGMWRANWAFDADIVSFFDNIDHGILMTLVEQRMSDRRILKLIRQWLEAGVMEEGELRHSLLGTPQGGVISPLLANIYLHFLDRKWEKHAGHIGKLVRYADDLVILCRTRRDAEKAQRGIGELLGRLKLQLHPEKTKLVGLYNGQAGFDFLGFQHRMVESRRKKGRYYPTRWPSQKAERSMRQKVKQLVGPVGCLREAPGVLIKRLNSRITGWANYYGVGTTSSRFCHLDWYIEARMRLYLNKKHRIHPRHQTGKFTTKWFRAKGLKSLRDAVQHRQANAPGERHRRAV